MFIVIDGPDGSGKTTLAKHLVQQLCLENHQAIYTSEPTCDCEAGRSIRQMLQSDGITDVYAFADLFVADRKEHLINLILPHLEAGGWVVCDRYKYSALAYQQMQGVDVQYLIKSNETCLIPDYIFILLPSNTDILINRIVRRGDVAEMFEKEELLDVALYYYHNLSSYFPNENIWYLNADLPIEDNLCRIKSIISEKNLLPGQIESLCCQN